MKLTATVTAEVPASEKARECAQALHEARLDAQRVFEETGVYPDGYDPYRDFGDEQEWERSEQAALKGAVAKTAAAMKGWKQSKTDVGIFWCGLRGWCHQFQTYWERT